MRISTSMIYSSGTTNLNKLQSDLYNLQNQLSTNRRVLTPSDDPVAAAQALVVDQQRSINQRFIDNQSNANQQLADLDTRLGSVGDLLQSVMASAVQAGNGAYTDGDRKTIASDIRQRFDELVGLANSADSMGNYVFSGYRGTTQPFTLGGVVGSRTVSYNGDDGNRQLQVGASRFMDVSASGSDVFVRIPQGNGAFTFTAAAGNTGTGIASSPSTVTGFDGSSYQITFTAANTYDVTKTDPAGAVTTTTGNSYTSGSPLTLSGAGISVSISGTPAVGDQFNVSPSSNQDIFTTLDKMIGALETNISGNATATAAFQNTMNSVTQSLSQALDHVLTRQTAVGSRQNELDALTSQAKDLDLQYQSNLSDLQDLDYTSAITSLTNKKMVLEAAQASFSKISQLSLFSYL